jgi:hypothetical protein
MEGHGEAQQRFYQGLALLEGQGETGKDTRLRSDCGQNLKLSSGPYSRKSQKVTKAFVGSSVNRGNPPLT